MIKSNDSTEAELLEAIGKTGYLLESRVATKLRAANFRTLTNPAFIDPELNKSREYDINAYKTIPVYKSGEYEIYPTLICECKNSRYPTIFFMDEEHDFKPLIDEVRVSGIPSKIWSGNKYVPVQEFLKVGNYHHFCKPKVPPATQCCTFEKTKGVLTANYGADLYDTFKTLMMALEFVIDDDFKNISQWITAHKDNKFMDLSFYYPVVIYQGEIFLGHVSGDDVKIKPRQHIQFNPEFYSRYHNEVISYHIDVISYDYLPDFLKIMDSEMDIIRRALQKQKQKVMLSMKRIVEECNIHKDQPRTFRNIME
jgi:hypothetical protein